jgi:hypothetical protein
MTTRMVAIVLVVASTVLMSALSLAIGILRGSRPRDFPSDAGGNPSDRPRHSPLSY